MITIIKGKPDWDKYISMSNNADFYHTFDYHHLSKNNNETPILIVYTNNKNCVALPLLLRNIENTDFKDVTSVYGYAGILKIHLDEKFSTEDFKIKLNNFFREQQIVSVFSRLHPFLDYQDDLLSGIGEITTEGKVVYIDLNQTIDEQRAKFNKRLKSYLNKSRKYCTIIKGNAEEHLEIFMNIYHENMRRVDATDSYYFDLEYFKNIFSSKDFIPELLLCMHNESQTIIGGALFIKMGNMVQYHLSGLSENHFEVDPIKLLIDEMRIQATQEGYRYFNLGGGRGGKEDSLFRFKSGFSKNTKSFDLWKYIVDKDRYRQLTKDTLGKSVFDENINYFPTYRFKV